MVTAALRADHARGLNYEAVLFDFDGVLVDSEPIHYQCWKEILAPFGIALDWDYYVRNCIGIADREMIASLVKLADPALDFEVVYAEYPNKKALFRERMLRNPPVVPATIELINDLADYKIAVVTSSGKTEVAPVLDRMGLLDRLDAAVYADDVKRLKPAPDPYLRAAELLGVRRALVVEDSAAGIAAGRAAGFDVVEISTPGEVAEKVRRALDA